MNESQCSYLQDLLYDKLKKKQDMKLKLRLLHEDKTADTLHPHASMHVPAVNLPSR